MKVVKAQQDFASDGMNEKDLLQFALELWKDGRTTISRWVRR